MLGAEVGNNIKAYKILFKLERELRKFISLLLQKHFEHGWIKGIPPNILKKCEKRSSREKETYQEVENVSNLIVDYADFKDIKEIIIKNWSIFEIYFVGKELTENKLEELEIPRNIIAHNRIISTIELDRISVYSNDLKRCMDKELMTNE